MRYETVSIGDASLTFYVLSNSSEMNPSRKRPMVLICPGGGYSFTSDREAEPVAIRFCSFGFNTAVLRYTCGTPDAPAYPKPQQELADAVSYIRANADALNTNPSMIAVMGFSAGAHLAGSVGCMWKSFGEASRPDAIVLCYPVISSGKYAHRGSFDCLCGKDEKAQDCMSLEKLVTSDVPPTFIWHTKSDNAVPFENSLLFKQALDEHGVESKLVLFETGLHGLSLANREVSKMTRSSVNNEVCIWPEVVRTWLLKLFGEEWY